jgi:hypothetical protein
MQYLSRDNIEKIAEQIIRHYKDAYVPEKHLCYRVDPSELATLLGYHIFYVYITKEGSILGLTSSGTIWTTVYDTEMNEMLFLLDGNTILIEKRLLQSNRSIGRKNFTIAHELAHQIINHNFPEMHGAPHRTFCDYRMMPHPKRRVADWYEWQADALAAALLMPRDAVTDGMFMFGLGSGIKVLSKKYSRTKYEYFCEMAEYLQVSRIALAYRMEQLGLLERNLLIEEAQLMKGVS